ncbi:MAG: NUDIX domain-containing protein [Sphingomonadales bacterium]|nr:NUDIX domain-containing protein [Sphingomonadales bacterium]
MLFLIPPPLHRVALRAAHGVRRTWWRLRRPIVRGCRVVALDADGRVLLIRQSYGRPVWVLPAGGLKRGEDPLRAAARELAEETACLLAGARLAELAIEPLHGTANHVHIVTGRAIGEPRPDGREVIAARFFALDALPQDIARVLPEMLPRWAAAAVQAD